MAQNTKENGKTTYSTEKESKLGSMGPAIKGNIRRDRNADKENSWYSKIYKSKWAD